MEINCEKNGEIIFVITTDGLENSSEHYNYERIRRMISAKKEIGWEFLFLGANIDAEAEAEKIGIDRNRSVTYENDAKGIAINFQTVGDALSKAVCCEPESAYFSDDWKEDIKKYHETKAQKQEGK